MKAVKLSDKINYLHFPGESGDQESLGIMVFTGAGVYPVRVQEIKSRSDFTFWYSQFKATEQRVSLESTLEV